MDILEYFLQIFWHFCFIQLTIVLTFLREIILLTPMRNALF